MMEVGDEVIVEQGEETSQYGAKKAGTEV